MKKSILGPLGRLIRRTLLTILTVAAALAVGAYLVLNLIFTGPSPTARDMLTLSLLESEGTSWIPGKFLEEEQIEQIRSGAEAEATADITNPAAITPSAGSDSIRLETCTGSGYTAHVLLVGSPAQVTHSGADADTLLSSGATCALVNGGSGSSGYAGFNADGVLIVAHSMTESYAETIGIRDGFNGGPALIINGQVNLSVYNADSGRNCRTAIGQRADGTVIFLCVDGLDLDSMGATYQDVIDILVEYGAVNACAMDGGASSLMLYQETASGEVQTINTNSAPQSGSGASGFWVIRSAGEE